jgi:hypothetical protein
MMSIDSYIDAAGTDFPLRQRSWHEKARPVGLLQFTA